MMNRYIAALLVVLATTGMEAHTYQYALKIAVGDLSYKEFIKQPQARPFEDDLLAIIKAIKKARHDLSPSYQHNTDGTGAACLRTNSSSPLLPQGGSEQGIHACPSRHGHGYWKSIIIRGPCTR